MAQYVPTKGLKLPPIRVTASIPCYLDLQVAVKQVLPGSVLAQPFQVLVQANCPWQLKARLATTATASGTLHQVGATSLPIQIAPGQEVAIPCQVKHFAGEQVVAFEWSGQVTPQGEAVTMLPPTLQLWLETIDSPRMLSPVRTW